MKRVKPDGCCPHVNVEFTAIDYGNLLLHNNARATPAATHACCACGQAVSHKGIWPAESEYGGNGALQGCACGSTILIDVVRSELYCCSCRDYVYQSSFDEGRQLSHVARRYIDRGLSPGLPHHDPGPDVRAKRARASADPGLEALRTNLGDAKAAVLRAAASVGAAAVRVPGLQGRAEGAAALRLAAGGCAVAPDGFPAGLRGLNNLGNTCFMNSVLQVFIHSPLLRNYFLGQGHAQGACSKHSKEPSGTPCLSCELDAVFAAAYSGDRAPLSPADFLYSWWSFADNLAGYRQQDAHEFYLSALSGLTAAVIAEPRMARPRAAAPCRQGTPAAGCAASPVKKEYSSASPPGGAADAASPLGPSLTAGSGGQPPRGGPHRPAGGGAGCEAAAGAAAGAAAAATAAAPDEVGGADAHSAGEGDGGRFSGPPLSLVDAVFGGVLRSDVTCSVCGHTSTAYDPFLDISLDMVSAGPPPVGLLVPVVVPAGSRLPQSDTPPVSSPTGAAPRLAGAEDEETEADGVSRGGATVGARSGARPSASTCGGRSSLSAVSPASPSRSLSAGTGTGTATGTLAEEEEEEEDEEREGEEDVQPPQGRSAAGCASPSTGSGSVPVAAGGLEEGPTAGRSPQRRERCNGASTASDESCGPPGRPAGAVKGAAGTATAGALPAARQGGSVASGRRAAAKGPAAGATAGPQPPAERAAGPPGAARPARTTSDSVAAAESAADGGGGGQGEVVDCITSPRAAVEHRQQQRGVQECIAIDLVEGGPDRPDWPPTSGELRPDSRGLTPGVSTSCVEDVDADAEAEATAAGPSPSPGTEQDRPEEEEEEGAEPSGMQTADPALEEQPRRGGWGGRRGGAVTGRGLRGRGRGGGRGRRGGGAGGRATGAAGGRGAGRRGGRGAGGGGGGSVPQMGAPGASPDAMVDPSSTRRPGGAADAEAGPGAAQAGATGAAGHATLHGCLRHFVTPERLSAGEAWVCSACQRRQPAVKQLSIRRLPPVLALHVKRFEHRHHHHHHHHRHHHHDPQQQLQFQQLQQAAGGDLAGSQGIGMACGAAPGVGAPGGGGLAASAPPRSGRHAPRKIQTQLIFPVTLDLSPYTTPTILRDRYCMRNNNQQQRPPSGGVTSARDGALAIKAEPEEGNPPAAGGGSAPAGPAPSCRYQLFAVISHKGDLSGGHYVVFVRPGGAAGGSWYQCDDAWVTAVSEEDVTSCQAYMLFYTVEM